MDSEWYDGIFLGLAGTSSEAHIGTADGVVKANDFKLEEDTPYNMEDIMSFKTSIREYVEGSPSDDKITFERTEPTQAQACEPTIRDVCD